MEIVLVEPDIPQNTGNIARTCALTRSSLHLIKPLGFSVEDRYLKRAGLDYWDHVDVTLWDNWEQFWTHHSTRRLWLATTKASCSHDAVEYRPDDVLFLAVKRKDCRANIESILRQQIVFPCWILAVRSICPIPYNHLI